MLCGRVDGRAGAQGETLEQQFGEKEVCFRTLDLYTSAVLESALNPTRPPKPDYRTAMDAMSKARPRPSVPYHITPVRGMSGAHAMLGAPATAKLLECQD